MKTQPKPISLQQTITTFMNYQIFARVLVMCLFVTTTALGQNEIKQNEFGFELYQRLTDGNQNNVFFSPLSVNAALYMAYAGAEGETQTAFEKMLNLSNDKENNLKAFEAYFNNTTKIKNVELSQVNHFWFGENTPIKEGYLHQLTNLKVQSDGMNFLDDPNQARKAINQHVYEQSKEKIKDILPANSIDHRTRFVMTNAIFFKGKWDENFLEEENSLEAFSASNGKTPIVDFMNKKWLYAYKETADAQILEIPYKGGAMSMILVLPKSDKKLTTIEDKFNELSYNDWTTGLKRVQVVVSIPKFKTGATIDLASYFAEMGLDVAFTNEANFKGITDISTNLSDMYHQSFVEVNETGTEAGAATVSIGMAKGIAVDVPIFKANRPFMYIIKENVDNQILFMGRMSNPLQKEVTFDNPTLKLTSNTKGQDIIHQVKSGETLYKIAEQHNVKKSDLKVLNKLESDVITEGQKLVIREEFSSKGISKVDKKRAIFIPKEIPTSFDEPIFATAPKVIKKPTGLHQVSQGETLYSISKRYDVSVRFIKSFNDLETDGVTIGQELIVSKLAISTFDYVIKSGDSLSKLAKDYNTTVDMIKALNHLSNDTIYIGQKIEIQKIEKK